MTHLFGSNTIEKLDKSSFDIEIVATATSIVDSMFSGLTKMSGIVLPDNLESIGAQAFYGCSSLQTITLPGDLQSIGEQAFTGTILKSITIPSSVTSIGAQAFSGVDTLVEVTFDDIDNSQLTEIGANAFSQTKIASVELPSTLVELGIGAFAECVSLETVRFNGNLVTIFADELFSGCYSLKTVNVPTNLTEIGMSTFKSCISLLTITLPDSLVKIGESSFKSCESINDVELPSGVTSIPTSAFEGCFMLDSFTFGYRVTEILSSAFKYCYLTDIDYRLEDDTLSVGLPLSLMYIYDSAFSYTSMTDLVIPSNVRDIKSAAFSYAELLVNVDIASEYISTINDSVFSNCTLLSSFEVTAPNDNLTVIGNSAFMNNSHLNNFNFANITKIGQSSFANTGFTSVLLGSANITSIGSSAFTGCQVLEEVTLPLTITAINSQTFSTCPNLHNITIPANVEYIGSNAFNGCGSGELTITSGGVSQTTTNYFEVHILSTTAVAIDDLAFGQVTTDTLGSSLGTMYSIQGVDNPVTNSIYVQNAAINQYRSLYCWIDYIPNLVTE